MTDSSEAATVPAADASGPRLRRRAVLLLALAAAVWLALFSLWRGLPALAPGSELIYKTKVRALKTADVFPPAGGPRVVVIGNSRTLAGFIPARFDAAVGGGCVSYNLGLPGRSHFLPELETLLAGGDVPTHVLLQTPWPAREQPPSWRDRLQDDQRLIERAFPFRDLPRNLAIFVFLSRRHGGLRAFYAQKQRIAAQMLADRGYYFIAGQSRYADDRLPPEFALSTDKPAEVYVRTASTRALAFDRLRALARRHGFQVVFIPEYYRAHNYAEPPPRNAALAAKLVPYDRFHVAGPDYWRFANRYFSDSVHLNCEGARRYTDRLAGLFTRVLARTTAPTVPDGRGP